MLPDGAQLSLCANRGRPGKAVSKIFSKPGIVLGLLLAWRAGAYCQLVPPEPPSQTAPNPLIGAEEFRLAPGAGLGALERVRRFSPPDTLTVFGSQSYYHTDNLILTTANRRAANAW